MRDLEKENDLLRNMMQAMCSYYYQQSLSMVEMVNKSTDPAIVQYIHAAR